MHAPVAVLILSLLGGWSSSGPTGGAVNAVVVSPSDPSIIWVGNTAGVFRSTDGGATWSSGGGRLIDIGYLAVHPADANKAWALTGSVQTARLYRTTDGGATWVDSTDGLPALRPTALLLDPRDPDTLYIGSRCGTIGFAAPIQPQFHETAGVFKSTDGGASWREVFPTSSSFALCIEELALDPFSPWRLFTTGPFSDVSGQWESYDNGQRWERTTIARPGLGVVFDARFPFTHYGITSALGSRFLVSQDGGFTWNAVSTNLLNAQIAPTALSMDPERSRIFLGTTSGLYRSGNGGTVWAKTSLQDLRVTALGFGGEPRGLFAGTSEGMYEVLNRGLGAARPIDLHDASANVVGLAVDPSDPNVVYAGVRSPIFSDPLRGRVFRSTDGGVSWQRLAGDDDVAKADVITVDGAGTVYAISPATTALYRRGRGETAWTVIPNRPGYDVAADPKNAGTVFLTMSGRLERSRDGGATWTEVTKLQVLSRIAIDPSDPRWVYVGSQFELLRSSDGGDTWTVVEPFSPAHGTAAIVVAPSKGEVLYRIVDDAGIPRMERSDDRAATWRRLPLPNGVVPNAIAVDPRNENSAWAAAGSGIYHSADGGVTWQKVEGPFLTSSPATSMRFDPSGRRLHVVFPEHGVWELTPD